MSMLCSALAITVGSPAAWAGSKTATVEFGTLESVARASNGDTIEVSGAGSFNMQPKSVSGDAPVIEAAFGSVPRTFIHRDAQGNVLAEGTWESTAVLAYRSFGPATEEQNAELGLPAGSEGGEVLIKVALFVDGAHVADGILTIVCELGKPPKNSEEATLLLVQGTSLNFNEVVSGDNIFIRE
jgi:hypothetical protein